MVKHQLLFSDNYYLGVVRGEVADLKNDFMGTNGNVSNQIAFYC